MGLSEVVDRVLRWLHEGYPDGVPYTDYVPLFALLDKRLTENEIEDFAGKLEGLSDAATAQVIREALATRGEHHPTDAEVARVQARIEEGRAKSGDAEIP
jgi:hypothetical protein